MVQCLICISGYYYHICQLTVTVAKSYGFAVPLEYEFGLPLCLNSILLSPYE